MEGKLAATLYAWAGDGTVGIKSEGKAMGNRKIGRITTLISATFLLLVPLLTGCGGESQQAGEKSGPTRLVTDIEGTQIKVPEHPERVITLSEPSLDGVIALGKKPIGTITGRGQQTVPNYLIDKAGDIPILGGVGQLDFEAIGASHPDLILVDGTSINNNKPMVDSLRKIAPVVFTGYAGGDWKTNFRNLSDALNMKNEGEEVIEKYNKRIEEAKPSLKKYSDQTFSIVRWQGNSASLVLKELLAGRTLTDLGLQRPPVQDKNGGGHSEPVSLENITDIDADWMFFGTLGGSSVNNPKAGGSSDLSAAEKAIKDAEKTPGFTTLTAYKNNHIVPVDGSTWTSTGGPLLVNKIIDDVLAALT